MEKRKLMLTGPQWEALKGAVDGSITSTDNYNLKAALKAVGVDVVENLTGIRLVNTAKLIIEKGYDDNFMVDISEVIGRFISWLEDADYEDIATVIGPVYGVVMTPVIKEGEDTVLECIPTIDYQNGLEDLKLDSE